MKERLTKQDIRMIKFFHQERGNIERWTEWEERKEIVRKEIPILLEIFTQLVAYRRLLNYVVDELNEEDYPDEE